MTSNNLASNNYLATMQCRAKSNNWQWMMAAATAQCQQWQWQQCKKQQSKVAAVAPVHAAWVVWCMWFAHCCGIGGLASIVLWQHWQQHWQHQCMSCSSIGSGIVPQCCQWCCMLCHGIVLPAFIPSCHGSVFCVAVLHVVSWHLCHSQTEKWIELCA